MLMALQLTITGGNYVRREELSRILGSEPEPHSLFLHLSSKGYITQWLNLVDLCAIVPGQTCCSWGLGGLVWKDTGAQVWATGSMGGFMRLWAYPKLGIPEVPQFMFGVLGQYWRRRLQILWQGRAGY